MKTTSKLFLDQSYVIDGVELTGEEIRDAIIDAAFLKGRLSELLGGEWV
ncbi:MAG: hypothetical protein IJ258_11275 [Methanobrevibacter sp.]|nr:hypothetical protein [Methanobrevibacter sp.]MBQ8018659.1 hypothetical protein [Methanobrevibacter sp.]